MRRLLLQLEQAVDLRRESLEPVGAALVHAAERELEFLHGAVEAAEGAERVLELRDAGVEPELERLGGGARRRLGGGARRRLGGEQVRRREELGLRERVDGVARALV